MVCSPPQLGEDEAIFFWAYSSDGLKVASTTKQIIVANQPTPPKHTPPRNKALLNPY